MEDFFIDFVVKWNVVEVVVGLEKFLLCGYDDYDDKFDLYVWMNLDIWVLIVG